MPVCGGEEEEEEEVDEERMACRRSFHRAWALLDRGGDKAAMMFSGGAAPVCGVWSAVSGKGGKGEVAFCWRGLGERCSLSLHLYPRPKTHPKQHTVHTTQAHGRVPGGQTRGCRLDGGCHNFFFFAAATSKSPWPSFSRTCQGGGGGGWQHGARQPGGGTDRGQGR